MLMNCFKGIGIRSHVVVSPICVWEILLQTVIIFSSGHCSMNIFSKAAFLVTSKFLVHLPG